MRKIRIIVAALLMLAMTVGMLTAFGGEKAQAAAKPAKAKITAKVNADGTSVTLTIAKTKNAQGYKIMVKKPGAKKFTKLAMIKEDGTAKRTYTAKNLKKGEYQFKVRAFLKSGKKTVWGKFSKVAKVKVSKTAETPAKKKVTKQDWAGEYITDDGGSMVVKYSDDDGGVLCFTEIKFNEKQTPFSFYYNVYVDDNYPIKERDTKDWDFSNMIRSYGNEMIYYIISFNSDGTISLRQMDAGGSLNYNVFKNGTIPAEEPEPEERKQTVKYVSTLNDLKNIDAKDSSIKYILKNDIDMTGWKEPIEIMYCSVDGAGYTLKNLSAPFVIYLWGGEIENLKFDICFTSAYVYKYGYAAPICETSENDDFKGSVIRNCKATGTINLKGGSDDYEYLFVGGLAGVVGAGSIERCVSEVEINVKGYLHETIGGIVGVTTGTGSVSECLNAGNIYAESEYIWGVGGIVGRGQSGSTFVINCLNTGTIKAEGTDNNLGGGLFGSGYDKSENCVSLGTADRGVLGSTIDSLTVYSWFSDGTEYYKNIYISNIFVDGFGWSLEPEEVQGVKRVSDITDKSEFKGLDFDKIWEMTENGPMLRNIPK